MKTYTWNPEDYEKSSSAQKSWAQELIAKLELTGSERILDIGCGDGKITAELSRYVKKGYVLGVDSSAEMIELARTRYLSSRFANLNFQVADAQKLPFHEEFDVIFSNAALHWVLDHAPVLAGIHRSLRPGGRALLQMGGKGNAADIFSVLDQMLTEPLWRSYFNDFKFPWGFFDPSEYKPWVEASGLFPVRLELVLKDMAHETPSDLTAWIRTTWLPYTERMPENRREDFIAEIVKRYMSAFPPDKKGHVHVLMKRLEVEALKSALPGKNI